MRDKLNRFVDNTIGNFQEVSYKDAIYQCMDLVYEWVFVLDFPKATIQHEFAYQVFTEASDITRQYFDIIKNETSTIPLEGDITVYNKTSSNKAGHVAIVIEATQSKMKLYEQNNPLGTNASIHDRNYNNCLGFLRPKYSEPSGTPDYFETLLQESNLSLDREGEFRAYWEKAKRYDEETNTLKEQVISANEALADRALEVSMLIEKNQKLSDAKDESEELYNKTRSELSEKTFEAEKFAIEVETLKEKIDKLSEKIIKLSSKECLNRFNFLEMVWYKLKRR